MLSHSDVEWESGPLKKVNHDKHYSNCMLDSHGSSDWNIDGSSSMAGPSVSASIPEKEKEKEEEPVGRTLQRFSHASDPHNWLKNEASLSEFVLLLYCSTDLTSSPITKKLLDSFSESKDRISEIGGKTIGVASATIDELAVLEAGTTIPLINDALGTIAKRYGMSGTYANDVFAADPGILVLSNAMDIIFQENPKKMVCTRKGYTNDVLSLVADRVSRGLTAETADKPFASYSSSGSLKKFSLKRLLGKTKSHFRKKNEPAKPQGVSPRPSIGARSAFDH